MFFTRTHTYHFSVPKQELKNMIDQYPAEKISRIIHEYNFMLKCEKIAASTIDFKNIATVYSDEILKNKEDNDKAIKEIKDIEHEEKRAIAAVPEILKVGEGSVDHFNIETLSKKMHSISDSAFYDSLAVVALENSKAEIATLLSKLTSAMLQDLHITTDSLVKIIQAVSKLYLPHQHHQLSQLLDYSFKFVVAIENYNFDQLKYLIKGVANLGFYNRPIELNCYKIIFNAILKDITREKLLNHPSITAIILHCLAIIAVNCKGKANGQQLQKECSKTAHALFSLLKPNDFTSNQFSEIDRRQVYLSAAYFSQQHFQKSIVNLINYPSEKFPDSHPQVELTKLLAKYCSDTFQVKDEHSVDRGLPRVDVFLEPRIPMKEKKGVIVQGDGSKHFYIGTSDLIPKDKLIQHLHHKHADGVVRVNFRGWKLKSESEKLQLVMEAFESAGLKPAEYFNHLKEKLVVHNQSFLKHKIPEVSYAAAAAAPQPP